MKKYLLIFVLIFSFFIFNDNVFASNDYLFSTVTLDGGTPNGSTGSQHPGLTSASTTYARLVFGYYNINGTFKGGEKWRIVADYCVLDNKFESYFVQSTNGLFINKFNWKYGSDCTYTDSDGYVYLGTNITFTFDFTIDSVDSTQGFANLIFNKNGKDKTWFAFKDYTIYPSSEITDIDNTQNVIDNQNKNQQETNDRLDNINGSLNDDTAPDTNSAFSDIKLNTNSAISNLVLMPINYLNRVLTLSQNTCSSYSIDFGIFNSNYKLNLPCIKLENYFGSTWWNVIDYLICFFMIYNIIMLAISAFEDITSLRDSYDSLYQPKHADTGYKPKHGGD